jgi:hypothetical protein
VEILEVDAAEACAFSREDTVEENFDQLKRSRVGSNISGVTDLATSNGNPGTIRVVLFRTDFADYKGMADFLSLVRWDIFVLNQEEGIGTIDMFCAGLGAGADALAESAKFVCIGGVPSYLVQGVTAELAVFKNLPDDGSSTKQAVELSTLFKALQRYAKPPISLGVMSSD